MSSSRRISALLSEKGEEMLGEKKNHQQQARQEREQSNNQKDPAKTSPTPKACGADAREGVLSEIGFVLGQLNQPLHTPLNAACVIADQVCPCRQDGRFCLWCQTRDL